MTDTAPPNGDTPPPNPLADLALGSQFSPFAAGSYEWRKLAIQVRRPGETVPESVTVYLLIWSDANGRHACNLVGDEAMRDFLRTAQEQFSGLYLPPGG